MAKKSKSKWTQEEVEAAQNALLTAKAVAYHSGKDGRGLDLDLETLEITGKATGTSSICKKPKKGEHLFSGIHNRTIFTGTPERDTDNLTILRQMNSGSVDLIYLDPPFNSKRDYAAPIGSAAGKVGAFFSDMFARDDRLKLMQEEILSVSPSVYSVIHSAGLARDKSARSYLTFMATRLMEMKRVLKNTGSIYLHCDPTMSHPLKMLMDAIFGAAQFRNEIVWCYPPGGHGPKYGFHRKHDLLLYYGKSDKGIFNRPYHPLSESAKKKFNFRDAKTGRLYKEYPGGRSYLDESKGSPVPSWWTDIHSLGQTISKERTGYRTQKPLSLLTRIISASSNPGDIVLDPFCGCGTACDAAQRLGRKWIGIDASCAAGSVMIEQRESGQGGLEENRDLVNWRMINEKGRDLPVRTDGGKVSLNPAADKKTPPKNKTRLTSQQKTEAVKHNWDIQRGECPGCGEQKPLNDFTLDHKRALSKGGTDDPENLQAMCFKCNTLKGNGTMESLWRKLVERGDRISREGTRWALGVANKNPLL